jgi:AbiV family abortive infection protein
VAGKLNQWQKLASMYPLNKAEAQHGFEQAMANGRRFLEDAHSLAGEGRHNSAALLGIYAMDEFGKAALIARAYLRPDRSQNTWAEFYEYLVNHRRKFEEASLLVELYRGAFMLPDEYITSIKEHLAGFVLTRRRVVAFVDINNGLVVPPVVLTSTECADMLRRVDEVLTVLDRVSADILRRFAAAT